MKLSARDANRYFAKPDPDKTGLLIFGEDAMRVALKRQQVIAAVKTALAQFNTHDISAKKREQMIKTARNERHHRSKKAATRASWLARNDQVNRPDEPHVLEIDKRFQSIEPDDLEQLLAKFLGDDAVYVEIISKP